MANMAMGLFNLNLQVSGGVGPHDHPGKPEHFTGYSLQKQAVLYILQCERILLLFYEPGGVDKKAVKGYCQQKL